jgi:hypothetical protein
MPQVIARRLAARNNGLEKVRISVLNISYEVSVLPQRNYGQLLARVSAQVPMFQDIQKVTLPDGHNDLLK